MHEEQSSDSELVGRMARGDRGALAELYDRHAGRVLGLAVRLLGRRDQAEDLVHEIFLEAWRNAGQYAEGRGSVLTWLLLRTRSRGIDRKRTARRDRDFVAQSSAADATSSDPSDGPERKIDQKRIAEALRCVSGEELEIIVLGYFEGLSSTEIAEKVGIPVGTVKSRTRSALVKLRAQIAPQAEE
jgi:RNA polymerase sigma-70 factor (ECF subfamily)